MPDSQNLMKNQKNPKPQEAELGTIKPDEAEISRNTLAHVKWDDKGLIAAIVQDVNSKQVLMMAYMNAESL